MTASEGDSFRKFASLPFYTAVNRCLVEMCGLRPSQRVVDLGAGTGAVTTLILETMHPDGGEVVAIEPSESALEVARRDLQERWGAVVRFVSGKAENFSRFATATASEPQPRARAPSLSSSSRKAASVSFASPTRPTATG